jgi:hypothetical protein
MIARFVQNINSMVPPLSVDSPFERKTNRKGAKSAKFSLSLRSLRLGGSDSSLITSTNTQEGDYHQLIPSVTRN